MVAALASPKPLSTIAYDELLALLEGHLSPKKNVLVAQHQFLSKYQKENQSVSGFVATLRADISECEFVSPCACGTSVADIFLRAQFIRGLTNNSLREQLLQSETTKFCEIVSKAIALEAAKADAREITLKTSATSVINKVSVRNKMKNKNEFRAEKINKRKTSVDYKKLGIEGLCLRCGRNNHFAKECRLDRNKLKCTGCNKQGHVVKVCISTLQGKVSTGGAAVRSSTNHVKNIEQEDYGVYNVVNVYQNNSGQKIDTEQYYAEVNIEGRNVKFEVDSGSEYTFLPRSQYKKLKLGTLLPTNIVFRSYTQTTFVPDGKVIVRAKYKGVEITDEVYIVRDFCSPLLGRSWIRRLGIDLSNLDTTTTNTTNEIKLVSAINNIVKEFSEVFEQKIGCTPQYQISLKLRENVSPNYTKERTIPYSLMQRVNKELDELEKSGIITKTTSSDWGSPLVVIPKADGGVRLCVDYKVGVNKCLVDSHYPIRRVDDIFNSLRDSKFFCRLDLYKAYLHIPVDQKSAIIQTISTHRGTYRMNRLSFGIKTAPSEFNRIIDQILREVPKTEAYFDDIIVHGTTMEECTHNLRACLSRLREFDLHLNSAKCSFFQKSIEFLGHVIEHNTIKKSNSKISAIVNMPTPKNADDVKRFLGMVTYYSRFIPNISSVTTPLRQLIKKDSKFRWTSECEKSFVILKKELGSERVLMPYNPELDVQLACDASPTGIAGILSHVVDGHERPIAYASRALTSAEQNYSQLDREALAIVFSVQHFYEYLFARHFKLITDNHPIMRIFHHTSKLPQMTYSRLQRYAAFLSGFNYEIVCKKGVENANADCLSRAPDNKIFHKVNEIGHEVHLICSASIYQISDSKINYRSLQEQTCKDKELADILNKLRNSGNHSKLNKIESEYTIDSDVLFRGQRVVIPTTLQPHVLQELHATHLGMTKMKQLARRYVYWKSIDKDIENLVRSCPACATTQCSPAKAELHP